MTVDRSGASRVRLVMLGLLFGLAIAPAAGQTAPAEADAIGSSLADALSLATFGTITAQDRPPEITRRGADYQVRLPLRGFLAPPNAAVEALVHPLGGRALDIASMTFPSSGTFEPANGGGRPIEFTVGEQAIHALVDPEFLQASSFAANFGSVSLRANQPDLHTEQTLERYVLDGSVSAAQAGRLSFASRGKATNWHMTTSGGVALDSQVRGVSGHVSGEGLDHDQGSRLLAAARAFMADVRSPEAGTDGVSARQRQELRALVDAASGLLTGFETEETLDGIRFTAGADSRGSIDRVRMAMSGNALGARLNAQLEVGLDELAMSTLPAETAGLLPHHFSLKSVLDGVQTASLTALLRAATEPDADLGVLQDQALALFADSKARIAIESITFDCGPMRVAGSARVIPVADGQLSARVHVSATGVDALIALARRNPALQSVLPMMMIAKSRGHQAGDAFVWDFAFGL